MDGRGLFLRGRSQETPSPLLSFLLFSLAASARPLLSFLMSAASAARTPSRHSVPPSAPSRLHSRVFHGPSPHLTSQLILKRSIRQVLCKVQSDLTQFSSHMTKALSSICLLVPLIIAVQREKKEANSVKDVHDVFVCGSVIERRAFLSSAAIMRVHLSRSQARSSCGSELGVAGGGGGDKCTRTQSRPRRDL